MKHEREQGRPDRKERKLAILRLIPAAAILGGLAALPVSADISLSLDLDLEDAEVMTLSYECGDGEPFPVHYLNSDTDGLALVPVDDDHRVFANVVAASGARYVAGLKTGGFEVSFPRRLSYALKAFGYLPGSLYYLIVKKVTGWDKPRVASGKDKRHGIN